MLEFRELDHYSKSLNLAATERLYGAANRNRPWGLRRPIPTVKTASIYLV